MVTPDEQRALQLENAKADADQWSAVRDLNSSAAADRERLVASVNDEIASGKARAAEGRRRGAASQGRIEAIQRGEPVAGEFDKRESFAAILKRAGWTEADLGETRLLATIPEEHFNEFSKMAFDLGEKGPAPPNKTGRAGDPPQVWRTLTARPAAYEVARQFADALAQG